jgi:hypothetical protein
MQRVANLCVGHGKPRDGNLPGGQRDPVWSVGIALTKARRVLFFTMAYRSFAGFR